MAFPFFTVIVTALRLVSEPWYRSPLFLSVSLPLASIAVVAGAFALFRDGGSLDSKKRQMAALGIVSGVGFFLLIAMRLAGPDPVR